MDLLLLLLLFGCKKNNNPLNEPFAFYCDINGVHHSYDYGYGFVPQMEFKNDGINGCYIHAEFSNGSRDDLSMVINTLHKEAQTGIKYFLTNNVLGYSEYSPNDYGNVLFEADTTISFVTLTSMDTNSVVGNFEFHGQDNSGARVDIINGYFHLSTR